MRIPVITGWLVSLLLAGQAWAADLTGHWAGEVKLPNGQMAPFVLDLRQQGTVVTGTLAGINGAPDVQIKDGVLDKDRLTFWGIRKIGGADVRFDYVGKVSGEAIDFQILCADGTAAPLASRTTRSTGG